MTSKDASSAVVFIDDDTVDLEICRRYYKFSRWQNRIHTFADIGDFFTYLEGVKNNVDAMPAVVICDLFMRGMSGPDVIKKMRTDPYFKGSPPVILFSHSSGLLEGVDSFERGGFEFHQKPSSRKGYVEFFDNLKFSGLCAR